MNYEEQTAVWENLCENFPEGHYATRVTDEWDDIILFVYVDWEGELWPLGYVYYNQREGDCSGSWEGYCDCKWVSLDSPEEVERLGYELVS